MPNRKVLAVLGAAQFLMVLDQAVMNVAISQLVADFDTTVTTIQAVIALYALTMAALMLTGGKVGDIIGRRRAFIIGICIYATGSALTGASWSVPSLTLGWSILEGIGAALVLPALVALIAGNFPGQRPGDRLWRARRRRRRWHRGRPDPRGLGHHRLHLAAGVPRRGRGGGGNPPRHAVDRRTHPEARVPRLDWVGGVLSASGLALVVIGILEASTWGWLLPRNSPIEPFGLSLAPFVVAAGGLVLAGFRAWERRREEAGLDPLVHFRLFSIQSLRGGVAMLLSQNLILMGIFFTIPLFLQVVLGLDALETGVRCCPPRPGSSSPRWPGRCSPSASPPGDWSASGSRSSFSPL